MMELIVGAEVELKEMNEMTREGALVSDHGKVTRL